MSYFDKNSEWVERCQQLPEKEKDKIILKALQKDKALRDQTIYRYFSTELHTPVLFEECHEKIEDFFNFSISESRLNDLRYYCNAGIEKSNAEIAHFERVTKKYYETACLYLLVLQRLQICIFQQEGLLLNHKSSMNLCIRMWLKLNKLCKEKLHEDYLIEFEEDLRNWWALLQRHKKVTKLISKLPEKY